MPMLDEALLLIFSSAFVLLTERIVQDKIDLNGKVIL